MNKREQTKEKIRQAAFQCVARYGFEKTTLDDIAALVNLNKASLYYYYKNKEEIFLDITTSATRQFLENLKAGTLAIENQIKLRIRFFLLERAAYYLRMVAEVRISEETLRQVEHLFYAQIKDVEQEERIFLKSLLDQAIENGQLAPTDTEKLAVSLILYSEALKKMAKEAYPDGANTEQMQAFISQNLDFMLNLILDGLKKL